MAKNKLTPEEQLLNLIEKGEDFTKLKGEQKKVSFLAFINLRKLWLFLPSLKRTLRAKLAKLKSGGKEPNLKVLNKVLIGVSIALIGYLITDFTFRRPDINQICEKISTAKGWSFFKEVPEAEVRPFLHYLEMVQRRNIFSPVMLKIKEDPEVKTKKIVDALIENLKLVGISWSREPQAMIEDKKARKTYFLKPGDTITKLKIEAVLKDKVILSYKGEKVELR